MKVKFCVLEKTFDVDIEMHFVCIWLIEGNVNSSDMWAGFNTDTITMPTFDNIKVVAGQIGSRSYQGQRFKCHGPQYVNFLEPWK